MRIESFFYFRSAGFFRWSNDCLGPISSDRAYREIPIFKLKMKVRLANLTSQARSMYPLIYPLVRIMLLSPIWSLSLGSRLVYIFWGKCWFSVGGSRKNNYCLDGSAIKALPPPPLELNGSRNFFNKLKSPQKYNFSLMASPLSPPPPLLMALSLRKIFFLRLPKERVVVISSVNGFSGPIRGFGRMENGQWKRKKKIIFFLRKRVKKFPTHEIATVYTPAQTSF